MDATHRDLRVSGSHLDSGHEPGRSTKSRQRPDGAHHTRQRDPRPGQEVCRPSHTRPRTRTTARLRPHRAVISIFRSASAVGPPPVTSPRTYLTRAWARLNFEIWSRALPPSQTLVEEGDGIGWSRNPEGWWLLGKTPRRRPFVGISPELGRWFVAADWRLARVDVAAGCLAWIRPATPSPIPGCADLPAWGWGMRGIDPRLLQEMARLTGGCDIRVLWIDRDPSTPRRHAGWLRGLDGAPSGTVPRIVPHEAHAHQPDGGWITAEEKTLRTNPWARITALPPPGSLRPPPAPPQRPVLPTTAGLAIDLQGDGFS